MTCRGCYSAAVRRCVVIALFAACAAKKDPPPPPPALTAVDGCEQLPFAASTPIAKASGAAWLVLDGKLSLVVAADSGNDGAYVVLDPDTGETREQGKLPLDHGKDDIEGLAALGDTMYGLASNGWMRSWRRHGAGFE